MNEMNRYFGSSGGSLLVCPPHAGFSVGLATSRTALAMASSPWESWDRTEVAATTHGRRQHALVESWKRRLGVRPVAGGRLGLRRLPSSRPTRPEDFILARTLPDWPMPRFMAKVGQRRTTTRSLGARLTCNGTVTLGRPWQ